MLVVDWRPEALDDLLGIVTYIAQSDEKAAFRLQDRIESAVLLLSEHPYLGRSGRREGTREFVAHPNYVIVYSVAANSVAIVSVLHTRKRYP